MTKILVYNYSHQYALSRMQVEKIMDLLPNAQFQPIKEFHLCWDNRNAEPFEYVKETKTVYFSCPVERKSPEGVEKAVEDLLVGLARIKAGSRFFHPLREDERRTYDDFVELWKRRILDAFSRPPS